MAFPVSKYNGCCRCLSQTGKNHPLWEEMAGIRIQLILIDESTGIRDLT